MIKSLEVNGRDEDEAIASALKQLGLEREMVTVTVLERAKPGFLGIGRVPALVRVEYEVPDEVKPEAKPEQKPAKAGAKSQPKPAAKAPQSKAQNKPQNKAQSKAPKAEVKPGVKPEPKPAAAASSEHPEIRDFVSGLLERMGIEAQIEIKERDPKGILVNLSGPNMGAVIGRRGETLDAIQHITNYVINRGSDKHMHISVDAEEYRAKREESLVHLAEKMAAKVLKYKRSMALEPMNSYERHIIHTALQNYEGVTTSSTGVEPNRRVVVSYERPQQTSHKPQSREWA